MPEKTGLGNVEFRKGDIEALPVDDDSIDVAISNCVLNLVPDKDRAFREIHRVLQARRAAGRLGHGVAKPSLRRHSARTWKRWSAASAGRWSLDDYVSRLKRAGFAASRSRSTPKRPGRWSRSRGSCRRRGIEHLLSVNITATK